MDKEVLDQGSEASALQQQEQGRATGSELVTVMVLLAPMSASAWRTLAAWLEEVEEGVVRWLRVEDEVARVGEREVVRSCYKRLGRMSSFGDFSDEAFERYWTRISGKQGNYSLRRPPKLIIPQAVIRQ